MFLMQFRLCTHPQEGNLDAKFDSIMKNRLTKISMSVFIGSQTEIFQYSQQVSSLMKTVKLLICFFLHFMYHTNLLSPALVR